MKILVVGRAFPSRENKMLGAFEFEQAKMLARYGHEVFYPSIDLRSVRHQRKLGIYIVKIDNIHHIKICLPVGRALPSKLRNRLYSYLRNYLYKYICKRFGSPDIVSIHYPSIYSFSTFDVFRNNGSKIVVTEHWSKVLNKDLSDICLRNLIDFVNKSDAFICVGNPLKKSIIELTGSERDIHIIPNISSNSFSYIKKDKLESYFNFLAVGRLSIEKGYNKLIDAFNYGFKDNKQVHLHIVGGGDEYINLQNQIKDYGLDNQVFLHGVMTQEELSHFYHQCDGLVMPSDYETFGVPAIEAMACGLPVIVTSNTGVAQYINDSLGIIISDNSKDNIMIAMHELYQGINRFDNEMISRFVSDHFSEPVVYKMIIDIYKKVLLVD